MSRSNSNNLNNPCTRFFEWSGSEGKLKYWDKENEENIFIEMPFTFLVLDQLNTVTGFSDELQTGYFANEVRFAKDVLTVRTKKGIFKTGVWKTDLSTIPGARFTKSVYIAFYDEAKQLVIGNIKFSGSSLGGLSDAAIDANVKDREAELYSKQFLNTVGWFNFCGVNRDLESIAVKLVNKISDKKGSNSFYRPIFERMETVSETAENAAVQLDILLQEYLTAYFAKQGMENERPGPQPPTDNEDIRDARQREMDEYEAQREANDIPQFTGGIEKEMAQDSRFDTF